MNHGRWNRYMALTHGLLVLLVLFGAAAGQNGAGRWFPEKIAA
jgi:hypothetical protein